MPLSSTNTPRQTNDLSHLLDEIILELELHMMQQPALTQAIVSTTTLQNLMQTEEKWLRKLCDHPLTGADIKWLKCQGERLITHYRINLSDINDLIEEALHFLITNLVKLSDEISPAVLVDNVKKAKEALAEGHFYATLLKWQTHLTERRRFSHVMMENHQKWAHKFCTFLLQGEAAELPELEGSLCPFAEWLGSMEAKLLLFTPEKHHSLADNILLAHQNVHFEAHTTYLHWKLGEYLRAQTHFDSMMQNFLKLDSLMNDAIYHYQSNAYQHFLAFLIKERELDKRLSHYLIVNPSLLEQPSIFGDSKTALLESIQRALSEQLNRQNVDHISDLYQNSLHFVIAPSVDHQALLLKALAQVERGHQIPLENNVKVNWFELSQLTLYSVDQLRVFFKRLSTDETLPSMQPLSGSALTHYSKQTDQDLLFLARLQHCLNDRQLTLHFQPIVTDKNQCQLVECLVRLPMEDGRHIIAGQFLHLVEEYQLTEQLDLTVLNNLHDRVPELVGCTPAISVNLYPSSFNSPSILEAIERLHSQCQAQRISLILEITEHEAFKHEQTLFFLHEKGIKFSIDDFGSGYSNLSSLLDMAANETLEIVKLDGEMLAKIESQEKRRRMIAFIADMASELNLQPVICEYVDSKEKLDILKGMPGSLLYQGHYFSQALSLTELKAQYSVPLSTPLVK
jgi:EAL domain-containing protein (putative c-di-GMP-specific phosphodiesterase class I)